MLDMDKRTAHSRSEMGCVTSFSGNTSLLVPAVGATLVFFVCVTQTVNESIHAQFLLPPALMGHVTGILKFASDLRCVNHFLWLFIFITACHTPIFLLLR